ncbi:MAG TPA: DUF6644 family protein [Gammaproteobacteria bacterium]|nr:DUF6644 family protein [Gammaproteobacteria bacterium]
MLEFAEWLQATPVSVFIQSVTWVIPLLQSIHILMIGVVFVSILMIALRVLGRVRTDETFSAVWHRFAPWMWCGLAVMAVTGITLIVGEPIREFTALSFWLKMALIAAVVASTFVFARTVQPAASAPDREFSPATKTAVLAALLVWVVIVFLGRAIAYDVAVWGALSPSA